MVGVFLLMASVFAPPVATADQEKAIAAAIAKLESPRFAVREKAAKDLEELGAIAKPALRSAFSHKDWEVRGRAETIFARLVEAEASSLWPMPFIDSFWWDPAKRNYVSCEPFPEQVWFLNKAGRDARPYRNYRLATDAWVRTKLGDGANPRGLRLILAELHRRDEQFIGWSCTSWPGDVSAIPVVNWQEYIAAGK